MPVASSLTWGTRVRASVLMFVGLAGGTCGIALLYLGMRAVMDIGGSCASGGPYVPARPCPGGVTALIFGGVWGGIIFLGVYVWQAFKHKIPSFIALAWPALFLSLGWNFLDYGISPPGGGGLVWGWLVCAIVFGLMGALPLWFVAGPVARSFFRPPPRVEQAGPPTVLELQRLATAMKAKVARDAGGGTAVQARASSVAPTVQTAAKPDAMDDMVSELERLQYLHKSGSLTDDEFASAKARVIRGGR